MNNETRLMTDGLLALHQLTLLIDEHLHYPIKSVQGLVERIHRELNAGIENAKLAGKLKVDGEEPPRDRMAEGYAMIGLNSEGENAA